MTDRDDIADTSDPSNDKDDVDVQPDGTPTPAKHEDGNTDAGSNSDVASGGAPD